MKVLDLSIYILGTLLLGLAIFSYFIPIPEGSQYFLGLFSLILLGIISLVLLYSTRKIELIAKAAEEETLKVTERKELSRGRKSVMSIIPSSHFEVYKPTKIYLRVKNVCPTQGMRIYFSGLDYINPNNITLWIGPEEETEIKVRVIPVGQGERELAIEVRPLFDEAGNLIPEADADPLVFQSFSYKASERTVGGLTSTQRSLLKNIAKVAAVLTVVSGALFAYFPDLLTSADIITSFIPLFITLQIPILYLYFYLVNKLPLR